MWVTDDTELATNFKGEFEKDKEYYAMIFISAEEGSTIITFNDEYTRTLSKGNHTLKVSANGKEITTNFTIANTSFEKDNTPKTGTENILGCVVSVALVSLFGIAVIGKKSKQ